MRAWLAPALLLAACTGESALPTVDPGDPPVPGNGVANRIQLDGARAYGSVLVVPEVVTETAAFVVVHPFADGAPVRDDYTAAAFVPAGVSRDVRLLLDAPVSEGEPMIVMLHADVNRDGRFQFGDGTPPPDVPVIEGDTLVALRMAAPTPSEPTREDILASPALNAAKADTYRERAGFRADPAEARLRAVVHAYMHAVERPDRAVEHFDAFSDGAIVHDFPSGPIATRAAYDAFLKGPLSDIQGTAHEIETFTYQAVGDGTYRLAFDVDWDGLSPEGRRMRAVTRHSWALEDRGGDWPVIRRVAVEIAEPFTTLDD